MSEQQSNSQSDSPALVSPPGHVAVAVEELNATTPQFAPSAQQEAVPLPPESVPNAQWRLDELSKYVADRHRTLFNLVRRTAVEFWALGAALYHVRLILKRTGKYETWLAENGIAKRTAFEALKLYKAVGAKKEPIKEMTLTAAKEAFGIKKKQLPAPNAVATAGDPAQPPMGDKDVVAALKAALKHLERAGEVLVLQGPAIPRAEVEHFIQQINGQVSLIVDALVYEQPDKLDDQ